MESNSKKKQLKVFVTKAREFLYPRWVDTHKKWDDGKIPTLPSKYMCRYTCIFLKHILRSGGYGEWEIVLGRPPKELDETPEGKFGYRNADGKWHDHAWLVRGNAIIDITSDQLGGSPIFIGSSDDVRYNNNLTEQQASSDLKKLLPRAETWMRDWEQVVANKI